MIVALAELHLKLDAAEERRRRMEHEPVGARPDVGEVARRVVQALRPVGQLAKQSPGRELACRRDPGPAAVGHVDHARVGEPPVGARRRGGGRAVLARRHDRDEALSIGDDLAIISYGAYVHTALSIAEHLAVDAIGTAVLDLRTIAPLDKASVLAVARHCSRVLVVHEDTRTGGIGESVAAIIQEEAFEWLDAPVRVIGALDTPVPYSPPLEDAFLPGEGEIERAARLLLAY